MRYCQLLNYFSMLLIAVLFHCWSCATSFAQSSVPTPVPLVVLYQSKILSNGFQDYTTTFTQSEAMSTGATGQTAYIFYQMGNPFYRLFNSSGTDHMDSTTAGEGGYKTEGQIGGILAANQQSALPGLAPIQRYRNTSSGNSDHLTLTPSAIFQDGTPQNYQLEGTLGYGYGRYGSKTSSFNTYSVGPATISADFVAGGAIAQWIWNGTQFLNTTDYGRYMQVDIFYYDSSRKLYNPIEAGDQIGNSNRLYMHGSPVINNQISNGSLLTRTVPLEFGPGSAHGAFDANKDIPLIYPNIIIGKQVTLNFQNYGPVAQFNTYVQSPVQITNARIDIPSAWLLSQFGTFYVYNAEQDLLTSAALQSSCGGQQYPFPASPITYSGRVIISDSSLNNAIGVYRRKSTDQPNGTVVQMLDFRNCPDGTNTTAWLLQWQGTLNAGDNYFTTYMVNGPLNEVQVLMRRLYTNEY